MMDEVQPEPAKTSESPGLILTMYSTQWCGYCQRLKRQLERERVEFEVIDIEDNPEAEAVVLAANNGNATVPTVRYPDGSFATNPSLKDVLAKLA